MSPYITDHDNSSSSGISLDDTPSSTGYGSPRGQEPEDIAVVGMSCRVAGSSDSPEKLWQALLRKEVASGEIPAMRWEPYRRRDTRNAKILDSTTQRGYFLKNLEDFDNTFFGISNKEAVLMDPQQRITLEVSWEALEDAGIAPQSLAGSNTAVFIGVNSDDYSKLLLEDLPGVEAWMGIGTAYCGVPNRISYLLDLRGPSTAVDAACASSLVAIHHGRQSLLAGETDTAIVGGVNALCGPGLTRVLDEAGAISKEGVCRSFDQDANGYGRGEGAGLVVTVHQYGKDMLTPKLGIVILKRMSDAIADDDRILAVLKGSAVGQDGRTNGIMAPNGEAQKQVALTALGTIYPKSIQYVEAHATSTSVGDPVEIGAMSSVYGANRSQESPCYIGSIKPNIGHLEAGAGVMGFIKSLISINKGIIAPQANLKNLNPKVDWSKAGIKVPFERTEWPEAQIRRAAICSYGYGGSVSHAVIEAAPQSLPQALGWERTIADNEPTVILLSAPQEKRMPGVAKALTTWMSEGGTDVPIQSVAATLATRRGHHDYRAAVVAENRAQALELVDAFANGQKSAGVIADRVLSKDKQKGALWMFSGHGSQWPAMGQELIRQEPVFHDAVAQIEAIVLKEADFSVLAAMEVGDFESSDKVQILTYAMQIGLTAVLRAKGARPSAIIGHSVGEIAASVAAGALTPQEGAIVVSKRAVLYRQFMRKGAMVLVNLPSEEMKADLHDRSDIFVAIHSSPSSCVLSGTIPAIAEVSKSLESRGVKALEVKSDIAFHSPLLNGIAVPLTKLLIPVLAPRTPVIPLYSTALEDARHKAPRDAGYWVANMLRPVLLNNAVAAAAEDGHTVFLEVSAHPVIAHSANETLMDLGVEDSTVLPTLLRNKPTRKALWTALASMWSKGVPIHWKDTFRGVDWAQDVPKTIWKHQPFWKEIRTGSISTSVLHDVNNHTLLGQRIHIAGEKTTVFTTQLDESMKPFPGSHPLHGTEIVPAAVLFNTFLHATGNPSLHNVNLHVPVAISAPRNLQVIVQAQKVRLMSKLIQSVEDQVDDEASWLTHTSASLSDGGAKAGENLDIDVPTILSRLTNVLKPTFSIDYLANVGVPDMGFPWAVVSHVGNTEEMLALVNVDPSLAEGADLSWDASSWAPIFDAATSIGSTLFYDSPRLRMPAHVRKAEVCEGAVPPRMAYIYVQQASVDPTQPASHVTVADVSGKALAKFTAMRFSEIEGTPGERSNMDTLVHHLAWKPVPLPAEPVLPLDHVVMIAEKTHPMLAIYRKQLARKRINLTCLSCAKELSTVSSGGKTDGTIILYLPTEVGEEEDIPSASNAFTQDLLDIVKYTVTNLKGIRVFTLSDGALTGATTTALAQAPLVGLSRIIASEQPDSWGAFIEVDSTEFPFQAIKYVSGADVIKVEDTIAKVSRLRAIPQSALYPLDSPSHMTPKPEGTYLISGGLGALGLEVAAFLTERGARRIILLSRRALPPRKQWSSPSCPMAKEVRQIQALEQAGASIYSVAIDLGSPSAATSLQGKLDELSLPPVLGVVHAAGLVEDQLIMDATPASFARVLAPKVAGTLALHRCFPPASNLDFFILFSSCGQLFGFPGQGSYAAGNAFLDTMAEHRRAAGDRGAIALQWTSWRGLGMAATTPDSANFIEAELGSKGIASVSRDDAFRAWDYVASYDVSQGVVLRSLVLGAEDILPHDILEDIVVRRAPPSATATLDVTPNVDRTAVDRLPEPGPKRVEYLTNKISECVAGVLQLPSVEDVDPKAALADLGMDSVMTVALRRGLQGSLKVKVPPTLVWGCPTVGHLVGWFGKELG
ncbi:MAG: hypothetical protein LQ338_005990 [Usnochroma carphineum]|nr:MAG: hypothetical protein LQ338_005990 [Usnochroma carphineum]